MRRRTLYEDGDYKRRTDLLNMKFGDVLYTDHTYSRKVQPGTVYNTILGFCVADAQQMGDGKPRVITSAASYGLYNNVPSTKSNWANSSCKGTYIPTTDGTTNSFIKKNLNTSTARLGMFGSYNYVSVNKFNEGVYYVSLSSGAKIACNPYLQDLSRNDDFFSGVFLYTDGYTYSKVIRDKIVAENTSLANSSYKLFAYVMGPAGNKYDDNKIYIPTAAELAHVYVRWRELLDISFAAQEACGLTPNISRFFNYSGVHRFATCLSNDSSGTNVWTIDFGSFDSEWGAVMAKSRSTAEDVIPFIAVWEFDN